MMMLDHHHNNTTRLSPSSSSFADQEQQPATVDVLCGKDKTYAKHPGNILYRNLIQTMSRVYTETPTKQEKMRMTAEIVQTMKVEHGSRFLKLVTTAAGSSSSSTSSRWCGSAGARGTWEELSVTAARDKTSHALRFCAANPHHHHPQTSPSSLSSSSLAPPMVVSPALPSRRSLRAQRQRRIMHRHHHRRTVSSEKVPLLPYSTMSSSDCHTINIARDETTRPTEAYSMPQSYERNGETAYYAYSSKNHCDTADDNDPDGHYRNSNWYNTTSDHDDAHTTNTTNLDDTDSSMVTPDAVMSHYELSVTVIPNLSSDTTIAAAAATTRMVPRLEPTLLNDDEDLDAILREPLNWDEMENEDLFFL